MRLLTAVVAIVTPGLAACLTTPPSASIDAADATALDAQAADGSAVDGSPEPTCAGADCDQLLAVAMPGYPTQPPRKGEVDIGYYLLRRSATGEWAPIAEATGPSWHFNSVRWADCCGGPDSGPDGVPEALIAGYDGPYLARLLTGGDTLLGAAPLPLAGNEDGGTDRTYATWVDLDGDDDLDIVTGNPAVLFYRNVGGVFTVEAPLVAGHHHVAAGSWDDDPEDELALVGTAGIAVRDRGTGDWSSSVVVDGAESWRGLWCDLRGTDHPELVVVVGSQVYIYPNRGSAVDGNWLDAAARIDAGDGGFDDVQMVCGDLDGDGEEDLLYRAYNGWFRFAHGAASRQPLAGFGTNVVAISLGDTDGDGYLDLFASMDPERRVVMHRNESTGLGVFAFGPAVTVFEPALDQPRGLAWIAVQPGVLP